MKILLTGATGLIGKELGKALIHSGHEVIAVSRSASKAKRILPYLCSIVEWDGISPFPELNWNEVDGVIHLMGENIGDSRWTPDVKRRLLESRVRSTQLISEAVLRSGRELQCWIQGSAVGLYGESLSELPFDEDSSPGNGFLSDLCVQWEKSLPVFKFRTVFLRTGVVASHRGGAIPKMMTPFLSGIGGVMGNGNQRMSLIHLDDLIGFIVHAVESDVVRGVYNLVSHEPISQRKFIDEWARFFGVGRGLPVPVIALKLALGEMSSLLLQDQSVISKRMAASGYKMRYPTVESIIKEIGSWYRHPFSTAESPNSPVFQYYSEQFLPQSIEQVFPFFSEAKNLERITPEWLNFNILNVSTPQIEKDTRIHYQLKLHGIPLRWVTHIERWEPPYRFVDNQVSGPYRLWYHLHEFESVPGGTLMKDWVRFQLPLGKAGVAGLPMVLKDVQAIFAYRTEIIEEIFNKP